jgi:hypothetical protein
MVDHMHLGDVGGEALIGGPGPVDGQQTKHRFVDLGAVIDSASGQNDREFSLAHERTSDDLA